MKCKATSWQGCGLAVSSVSFPGDLTISFCGSGFDGEKVCCCQNSKSVCSSAYLLAKQEYLAARFAAHIEFVSARAHLAFFCDMSDMSISLFTEEEDMCDMCDMLKRQSEIAGEEQIFLS